ncbi:MAG TPA: hypothetical protein VKZ53_15520 [Candidatus Angelobacter sp.]|nr:hypothetical protein [Candidatus Angelobacter sp.]
MSSKATAPNVNTAAVTNIVLAWIECINPSELGKDEVYIQYKVDAEKDFQRFPANGYHSMGKGDKWYLELPLSFRESVEVGLYDNDGISDDFLGSHTYFSTTPQPATFPVSNTNGAEYLLHTNPTP